MRVRLSCDSKRIAWARSSVTGWPPGASVTSFVSRSASGPDRAIRSSRRVRFGQQLSGRDDSATRPAGAVVGVEVPAGQQHLLGDGLADQLAQPPAGSGRGEDAEAGLGVAEDAVRRGEPEVAGVRQLRAAAQRPAVDGGDGGQRQPGDPVEQAAVDALQRLLPAAPRSSAMSAPAANVPPSPVSSSSLGRSSRPAQTSCSSAPWPR
jgi:hypothetical protein